MYASYYYILSPIKSVPSIINAIKFLFSYSQYINEF